MKNSLYKILCLTLAFLMICSMSACKSNKDKSDNPNWWEDSGTTFVCKDGDTERLLKFRLAKAEMDPNIKLHTVFPPFRVNFYISEIASRATKKTGKAMLSQPCAHSLLPCLLPLFP